MAKRKLPAAPQAGTRSFYPRSEEDRGAIDRLLSRLKTPQGYYNGHNTDTGVDARWGNSAVGLRALPDQHQGEPTHHNDTGTHDETNGHHRESL